MNKFTTIQKKVIEFATEKINEKCPKNNKSLHCAIIVYKGVVLSWAVNNERANLDFNIGFQKKSIHAEWGCLRKLFRQGMLRNINKFDLYSVRINRQNQLANAKPCRLCTQLIMKYVPRKVIYSTQEGSFSDIF